VGEGHHSPGYDLVDVVSGRYTCKDRGEFLSWVRVAVFLVDCAEYVCADFAECCDVIM